MTENHPPLSVLAQKKLEEMFRLADQAAAAAMLLRVTAMGPGPLTSEQCDRCRLAALKLSKGIPGLLRGAVREFETDPRDLLMAASFGEDLEAHAKWAAGQD